MRYNNLLSMRDLFMNPKLGNVFPQFERSVPVQNVYSFAEVERRVLNYLQAALGGQITGRDELVVRGKYKTVLRQVNALKSAAEELFNSMPSIAKNLRKNTRLYTPFASAGQLEDMNDPQSKTAAMRVVLDNIRYNPDFVTKGGAAETAGYIRRQQLWKKKVGYKE